MTKFTLVLIAILFLSAGKSFQAAAQPYATGNASITYTDPDRGNRSVPVKVFYPASASGTNTPLAEGQFPVIAFGHGFIMVYSAYEYLWEVLVPEGYIMAFPTTEGSAIPAPDHMEFGRDLTFILGKIKSEGQNPGSLFYGHIADSSAIMGHSMGGGAAFLACANVSDVSTMITLAAAETNPSAIAAAQQVTIPSLVFSGSDDCVTPPGTNQEPMYNNLAGSCKTYISITGGGHCYFADYNFNCSLGELFCSPSASITRQQQHTLLLSHLVPYLDFMLRGNIGSWITFNNLISNPSGITSSHSCGIGFYDLRVFLEGPYQGPLMTNALNQSGKLPLAQPYSCMPWNYSGIESVVTMPDPEIVDWVLLEFRDASNAASANTTTSVGRRAAFLLRNGNVVDMDGTSLLRFDHTYQQSPFLVVHHRNHLSVLSSSSPVMADGFFSYFFTTGAGQAFGSDALKQLSGETFGLYGGDYNADGTIGPDDIEQGWNLQAGLQGYLSTDGDLDGQADNPDKNDRWLQNLGKNRQLPE